MNNLSKSRPAFQWYFGYSPIATRVCCYRPRRSWKKSGFGQSKKQTAASKWNWLKRNGSLIELLPFQIEINEMRIEKVKRMRICVQKVKIRWEKTKVRGKYKNVRKLGKKEVKFTSFDTGKNISAQYGRQKSANKWY